MSDNPMRSANLILAQFGAVCVGAGVLIGGLGGWVLKGQLAPQQRSMTLIIEDADRPSRTPDALYKEFARLSRPEQDAFVRGFVSTADLYGVERADCLVRYFYGAGAPGPAMLDKAARNWAAAATAARQDQRRAASVGHVEEAPAIVLLASLASSFCLTGH